MHDTKKVNVMEGILDENDLVGSRVKEAMGKKGILTVNMMGAPGVGKTTCLKGIIKNLKKNKPYIIEGDIESDIDTEDLRSMGLEAYQINTYGACHLDSPLVEHQIGHMNFQNPGILFIENIGNLVCPAEFSIGEHIKMLVSTVTEGSDKPYKYPLAFEKADIVLVNKTDLLPYVDFDQDFFVQGIRALNKEVPIIFVSGTTGQGYREVADWLEEKAKELREKGELL